MGYYFAPLEGLTDSIYRRLHHQHFPGIDRYYTPFLSPTVHRCLTPKEAKEIPYADTLGYHAIPQLLTKVPEDFNWMAQQCRDRGYGEVNLNLGCPSGTVTAKGKGAGMLRDPDALDRFLDGIFASAAVPISIKTRIGFSDKSEFPALFEIYNRYPVKELIVHPRVRTVFYKGAVQLDAFAYAAENCRIPLCYNGDVTDTEQATMIRSRFPQVSAIMVGRGLIGDPGMLSGGTSREKLRQFHDALLDSYIEAFGSPRNAMFRLKEHWRYLICKFDSTETLAKKLRKTTDIHEFRDITRNILCNCPIRAHLKADWTQKSVGE